MTSQGTTVALAINPTAGRGKGGVAGARAFEQLTSAGFGVRRLAGRNGADLAAQLAEVLADGANGANGANGAQSLVVVGGDGMVHLGVNAVAGTTTPLGIVACGTGNDIARGLGLPVDDAASAVTLITTHLRRDGPDCDDLSHRATARGRAIDAVRCTGPGQERHEWFAGVLGAGFDAIVNERANRWSRPRGHLRYDLAILRELPVFRPREYHMVLDGQEWTTGAMLVVVGNGTSYGGGMRVCPGARLDDGLLDVLVVSPMSRVAFVRLYPRVYSGRHVDHPLVEVRRARRVDLACDGGIVAYGDGERMAPLPLTLETVPGALRVLTGADST